MENRNLLVTLADDYFTDQAKQLFSSARKNGWRGDFLLLSHKISQDKKQDFINNGIKVFDCEPPLKIIASFGNWPAVVWDKLYLFSEFFKKWEKVVYLDADIIVQGSLSLFLQNDSISGVQSFGHLKNLYVSKAQIFSQSNLLCKLKNLKKETQWKNAPVFNTGAFSFPTTVIKTNTFMDLVSLAEKYGPVSASAEEAIINTYFQNKWQKLPITANFFIDFYLTALKLKPEDIHANILHFTQNKPWVRDDIFNKIWQNNLAQWAGKSLSNHDQGAEIEKFVVLFNKRKNKYWYRIILFRLNRNFYHMIGLAHKSLKLLMTS